MMRATRMISHGRISSHPPPVQANIVHFNVNPSADRLHRSRGAPLRRARTLLVTALISAAPAAFAQSDSTAGATGDSAATLNPFVVNVDKDHGFVAASSLAGGRLAGNLRDTPVAYSVLTRDFIEALQLTDVTEMTGACFR